MGRPTSARTRVVLLSAALLAAGCGADDPIAAEPPVSSSTSSTTSVPAETTTSTQPEPTTGTGAEPTMPSGLSDQIPDDWTALDSDFYQPDIVLLDPGDDERVTLSYGGDGTTLYDIDIDNGNQVHRTAMRGSTVATADGIWISVAIVDSDNPDLTEVNGPFGVAVSPRGTATIFAPADRTWGSDSGGAMWAAVVGSLVMLPDEPVGIGARWRIDTGNPDDAEFATVFSVMDIKGPLVTIGHGGVLHGGVTTIDTSSGRMIGRIETDDGFIVTDSRLTSGFVEGLPVALHIENEVTRNGERTSWFTANYFGESFGPIGSEPVPDFRGLASALPLESTPITAAIETREQWEHGPHASALRALFEQTMPTWAVGGAFIDRSPETPERMWLQQVGVGSSSVPVRWEIVEQLGSTITVRVDDTFTQEEIPRGFRYTLDGTVVGEFTVDRFHPWDVAGEVIVDFEIRTDDDVTEARQVWRAAPAPIADRTGWATFARRASPPVAEIITDGEGPDIPVIRSYGGGEWSGSTIIDQEWTRHQGQPDGAAFRLEADISSTFGPEGQFVEFTGGSVRTNLPALSDPALGETGFELDPFALVAEPSDVDRFGDQAAPSDHPFTFYQVLAEVTEIVTPTLPMEPILVGAQWTTAPANQLDLITATYTLVSIEGNEMTLAVVAPVDTYFGDRYDGWTIDADLTGEVTIDLSAAVVLSADLVADGTATFGTAGEPDPSTTEPWQHTLTITTEAA